MSIVEIKSLSLHEKLTLMEALWDDLRANADAVLIPEWHKNLLDARQIAVAKGQEQVLDWDAVKDSL